MIENRNGGKADGPPFQPGPLGGTPEDVLRLLEEHPHTKSVWEHAAVIIQLNIWRTAEEILRHMEILRRQVEEVLDASAPDPDDPEGAEDTPW